MDNGQLGLTLILLLIIVLLVITLIVKVLIRRADHIRQTSPAATLLSLSKHRKPFNSLTLYHLPSKPNPASSTTIFFIPGAGGSAEQFHNQIPHFHPTHNIILIDHPGHGINHHQQPPKQTLSPTSLTKHLHTTITHFSTEKNILIAHSYGCALLPLLLPQLSINIQNILLISPPLPHPKSLLSSIILSLPSPLLSLLRIRDRKDGPYSSSVQRMVHTNADLQVREQQLIWNKRTSSWVVKALMTQRYVPSVQEYGTGLKGRGCVIVVGKDDRLTKVESGVVIGEECEGRVVVVEECGHQVMVERPEVVNKVIGELVG